MIFKLTKKENIIYIYIYINTHRHTDTQTHTHIHHTQQTHHIKWVFETLRHFIVFVFVLSLFLFV